MSKMEKKFNRRAIRKLIYKNKVRAGCLLTALSLVVLAAGAGPVRAADADKDTGKKVVSENKTKTEKPDKKKSTKDDKKDAPDTAQPTVTQVPKKETVAPQATAAETPAPTKEPKPDGEGAEGDGDEGEEIPEGETEKEKDTDETSQGPQTDEGKDGADEESPAPTEGPADTPVADVTGGEAAKEETVGGQESTRQDGTSKEDGWTGDISVQPLPAESEGPADGQVYTEETDPIPVAGILEGASTVIVGGLAPIAQQGSAGQEQVDREAETDSGGESSEGEGEESDGPQSRIAGSTPLVGGMIAGEGTGSGTTVKNTSTPTAAPSKAPSSTSTATRATVTAYPTATTSAAPSSLQGERVAMDDAAAGQQIVSPVRNDPATGLQRVGVKTGDSTKIIPFIIAGAAALAAIVALAALKIKKGRKDQMDPSDQEQE